jgi:hypothetical protein
MTGCRFASLIIVPPFVGSVVFMPIPEFFNKKM